MRVYIYVCNVYILQYMFDVSSLVGLKRKVCHIRFIFLIVVAIMMFIALVIKELRALSSMQPSGYSY